MYFYGNVIDGVGKISKVGLILGIFICFDPPTLFTEAAGRKAMTTIITSNPDIATAALSFAIGGLAHNIADSPPFQFSI